MTQLPRWLPAGLRRLLTRPKATTADSLYLVTNLTRQTEIAIHAEIAGHGSQRRKGLLGRSSLAPGQGLWIVPCESVHTFFMQFAIDLIYLDRKQRIKKIKTAVGPWRISACLSAHSVIELPAGTISASQSRPGDQLALTAFLAAAAPDPNSDANLPIPAPILATVPEAEFDPAIGARPNSTSRHPSPQVAHTLSSQPAGEPSRVRP